MLKNKIIPCIDTKDEKILTSSRTSSLNDVKKIFKLKNLN